MAPRTTNVRGFTIAERRSLAFEKVSLYAVFFVALIAAVVSFVAMQWVGIQLGMGWAAPLIPLAIDGFAIACSVGIVRSQGSGERARERVSEWTGLFTALALSIAGNVFHVVHTSTDLLPYWLKVAFAASIPVLLAYGIHVYGRAMSRGISSKVLADDPDTLHLDLLSVSEAAERAARKEAGTRTPSARTVSARRPSAPSIERAHGATDARAADAHASTAPSAGVRTLGVVPASTEMSERAPSDMDRARDLFDAALRADPFVKPDAAAIHRAINTAKSPASTRRWVSRWWDEYNAETGMARSDSADEELAGPGGAPDDADETVSA